MILFLLLFLKLMPILDLNIISFIKYKNGWGQIAPNIIINLLNKNISVGFVNSRNSNWSLNDFTDCNNYLINLANKQPEESRFGLFIDVPYPQIAQCQKFSKINIAYTMTEKMPVDKIFIDSLMENFDAIIVPHEWLINNYKKSGFNKPIFCIPLGLSIGNIQDEIKINNNKKITFGFTGSPFPNKNHEKLITIFLETFKNIDNVELLIHSSPFPGREEYINNLKKYESSKKIKILYNELTNDEYLKFLTSLDIFISLSNGEGYSLTAREAISLGIPCLLTNSTGHSNLINNKNVIGIDVVFKNNVWEPIDKDVQKKLIYAYENKDKLSTIGLNKKLKNFCKYKWETIIVNFINFFDPKKIIYGHDNLILNEYLMTNDLNFYEKIINS